MPILQLICLRTKASTCYPVWPGRIKTLGSRCGLCTRNLATPPLRLGGLGFPPARRDLRTGGRAPGASGCRCFRFRRPTWAQGRFRQSARGRPATPLMSSSVTCRVRHQTFGAATLDQRLVDRFIRGARGAWLCVIRWLLQPTGPPGRT